MQLSTASVQLLQFVSLQLLNIPNISSFPSFGFYFCFKLVSVLMDVKCLHVVSFSHDQ